MIHVFYNLGIRSQPHQDYTVNVHEGSPVLLLCFLDKNVEAPCWFMNGSIITFDRIPPEFQVDKYDVLKIPAISRTLNGSTSRCVGFDITSQEIIVQKRIAHLFVIPGM